ncbi:DUF1579 domain-containing protein [Psychroserpens sp. BH13MA-6]
MKKLLTTFALLLVICSVTAQSKDEMKALKESMTPSEQHEWLASFNGKWSAKVQMWMDPSQPPSISKATTENEMILDGLYQRSSHKGTMLEMPFHGESIMGYDNIKKKFVSTWIDNFGSGIMMLSGDFDKESKTLILEGSMADPMTGKDLWVREVLTKISDDEHKFEMFMVTPEGKETKTMEIYYKRKK